MKLKTIEVDGSVYAAIQDGKPVYVHDDGKEIPFDAVHTTATIKRLNNEAKTHREAREAAEGHLKAYEGLDADAARQAMETVRNFDDRELIDAGRVEKVKKEAKDTYDSQLREYEKKYKPIAEERDSLKSMLQRERLSTAFGRSKFIGEKVQTPVDLLQARFGPHFEVGDDGKIRAKDVDGNPIFSRVRAGEEADNFDEAIESLIYSHPDRDRMLKGTGASGGGAGGSRTGADGKRQVSRAEFERMDAAKQRETAMGGAEIVD